MWVCTAAAPSKPGPPGVFVYLDDVEELCATDSLAAVIDHST